MKPQACSGADNLPSLPGKRVVCHEGIVKVQDEGEPVLEMLSSLQTGGWALSLSSMKRSLAGQEYSFVDERNKIYSL